MTQQEILDYNKRCAEFLGFEISENKECFKIPNKNGWITLNVFHSDWNFIMEVVEAILKLPNIKSQEDTTQQSKRIAIQAYLGKTKKEAVVEAINQFLIWYNENK